MRGQEATECPMAQARRQKEAAMEEVRKLASQFVDDFDAGFGVMCATDDGRSISNGSMCSTCRTSENGNGSEASSNLHGCTAGSCLGLFSRAAPGPGSNGKITDYLATASMEWPRIRGLT